MSSTKDEKDASSRRNFFQDVTSGMTGLAMVAALSQMGVPVVNAAQGTEVKPKPDTVGGASLAAQPAADGAPKQAVSPFFQNPPSWPTGTDTHEFDHLFSTKLRENSWIPDIVPGPQAYFRGDSDLPGAKVNMGWQIFVKPYKLELESHHHDHDEYQFFLGATFPDLVGSFDAEIETFIGPEYERHIIKKATVLYLPAGLEHNPCDIRRLGKPLFFSSCELSPFFNGIYQTMGYMEMRSATKID
ncbi:MAG: hypothetical protein LBP68_02355 [Acidobacteriota bacterium]|jgi:hypothetical protein|nr:hypothetical protein [Acidobacteriota bacterium]